MNKKNNMPISVFISLILGWIFYIAGMAWLWIYDDIILSIISIIFLGNFFLIYCLIKLEIFKNNERMVRK